MSLMHVPFSKTANEEAACQLTRLQAASVYRQSSLNYRSRNVFKHVSESTNMLCCNIFHYVSMQYSMNFT